MASLGRSRFIKTRGVIYDPPATEFDVKTIVSSKTDNTVKIGGFSVKEGTNITLSPDTETSVLTINSTGGSSSIEFVQHAPVNVAPSSYDIASTDLVSTKIHNFDMSGASGNAIINALNPVVGSVLKIMYNGSTPRVTFVASFPGDTDPTTLTRNNSGNSYIEFIYNGTIWITTNQQNWGF